MTFRQAGFTPAISPDGRWIAWGETSTDWEQNAYVSQIWVMRRDTGEKWQLTRNKKSSTSPAWSPDSKWLAFASDRDGKRQVYVISPQGGEARGVTASETPVGSFAWSPDGKTIAYAATAAETKAHKDRNEKYGEFIIVEQDYTNAQLWVVEVDAAKPTARALTKAEDFHVSDFAWAPDGRELAVVAPKDPDLSHFDTADLYLVAVADGKATPLVTTPGPDTSPVWSPDGRELVFRTANGQVDSYFHRVGRLAVVPRTGGTPRIVSGQFDEDPSVLAWCATGIHFSAAQRTERALFRMNPADGSYERLHSQRLVAAGAAFSKDCGSVVMQASLPGEMAEIWVTPTTPFAPQKVTSLGEQLKPFTISTREPVQWKSKDGTVIEGVLIKPRNFDPKKQYPLLVVIHGGPTGVDTVAWSPDRYYPIERFVEKGALVLRPNYRGSAGYGEKFRSLNVRNLGVGDAWDVLSGVDHLVAQGFVDATRVGAMGWSQGGYISAFLTCSSDRFKAISVGAGISDWMTYYVNTDIHPFTRQYLKATPWQDPEIYRVTSPISYVKSAKTPTLIQHGELDKRVPPPNAFELYQALKDQKVETRLVIYKGFGHGIDKPREQRHVLEENEGWFEKYVLGGK